MNERDNEAEGQDPLIEECIRDALEPWMKVLTPEQIAEHRALLKVFITTHPAAKPLYERLRLRTPSIGGSGVVSREGATASPSVPMPSDGTFGKQ